METLSLSLQFTNVIKILNDEQINEYKKSIEAKYQEACSDYVDSDLAMYKDLALTYSDVLSRLNNEIARRKRLLLSQVATAITN
jgi:hypothetical protein